MAPNYAQILMKRLPNPRPVSLGDGAYPSVAAMMRGHHVEGWWDNVRCNTQIRADRHDTGLLFGYMDYQATPRNRDLRNRIASLENGQSLDDDPDGDGGAARAVDDNEGRDPNSDDDSSSDDPPPSPPPSGAAQPNAPATTAKTPRLLDNMTDAMERSLVERLLRARPLMEAGILNAETNDVSGPYALKADEPVEGYERVEGPRAWRLLPHQRDGVGRYQHLMDTFKGLLIADEMGLGKTRMVIAHIQLKVNAARLAGETPIFGIFVPKGLVSTWTKELKGSSLRYGDYSKPEYRSLSATELCNKFDVLVVPYGPLASEYKDILDQYIHRHAEREGHKDRLDKLLKERESVQVRPFEDLGPLDRTLFNIEFEEVIIDEAHHIKNPDTLLARAMRSLTSRGRVAITGTPLQNRVAEFGALLLFLRIEPFNDPAIFKAAFTGKKTKGKKLKARTKEIAECNDAILSALRSAITIRRMKNQDFDGIGIMGIPDYVVKASNVRLSTVCVNFQQTTRDMWDMAYKAMLIRREEERLEDMANGVEVGPSLLPRRTDNEALVQILEARLNVIHPELVCASYDEFGVQILSKLEPGAPAAYGTLEEDSSLEATFEQYEKKLSRDEVKNRDNRRQEFLEPFKKEPDRWKSDRTFAVVERVKEILAEHRETAASLPEGKERNKFLATHKVLVFCEFLSALDLIEMGLKADDIDVLRFDGTVPQKKRDEARGQFEELNKDFEDGETEPDSNMVMLITNKAGNEGITLVHASDVVIVAPTWNPAIEDQLIARAARAGQESTVTVWRFHSENSIERKIRTLQHDKRVTIKRVLDDGWIVMKKNTISGGTDDAFLEMIGYHRCKSAMRRGVLGM